MRKFKIVFYVLLALYIVVSVIFVASNRALFDYFGVLGFNRFLLIWLVVGLIMLVTEVVFEQVHLRQLRIQKKAMEDELNKIKVKLYDIESEKREPGDL